MPRAPITTTLSPRNYYAHASRNQEEEEEEEEEGFFKASAVNEEDPEEGEEGETGGTGVEEREVANENGHGATSQG